MFQNLSQRFQFKFGEAGDLKELPGQPRSSSSTTIYPDRWMLQDLATVCPDLSMVIDLTNTKKYYRPQDLHSTFPKKIDYAKILTEGHVVPKQKVVAQFRRHVLRTLETNPAAIIGVHCTHGVNRTGYLICRYLVQEMGWRPSEAIAAFDLARGHKQERDNYLQDILKADWSSNQDQYQTPERQQRSHQVHDKRQSNYSYQNDRRNAINKWKVPSQRYERGHAHPNVGHGRSHRYEYQSDQHTNHDHGYQGYGGQGYQHYGQGQGYQAYGHDRDYQGYGGQHYSQRSRGQEYRHHSGGQEYQQGSRSQEYHCYSRDQEQQLLSGQEHQQHRREKHPRDEPRPNHPRRRRD